MSKAIKEPSIANWSNTILTCNDITSSQKRLVYLHAESQFRTNVDNDLVSVHHQIQQDLP